MSQETYNIVFKGQVVKNVAPEQAKKNLSALFNIDNQKIEALFSGKAAILKRNVSFEVATKYRAAIKKAGGIVELVPQEIKSDSSQDQMPTQKPVKAVFNVAQDLPQPKQEPSALTLEASSSTEPANSKPAETVHIAAPDYALSTIGENLLQANERAQVEPVDVDISNIHLAPAEGLLVNEDEHVRPTPIDIPNSSFTVAKQEGFLVDPDEIEHPKPVEVDISALQLGEQGERLSKEEKNDVPAPDVSHLSLADN